MLRRSEGFRRRLGAGQRLHGHLARSGSESSGGVEGQTKVGYRFFGCLVGDRSRCLVFLVGVFLVFGVLVFDVLFFEDMDLFKGKGKENKW